jgi:hypothetical protein
MTIARRFACIKELEIGFEIKSLKMEECYMKNNNLKFTLHFGLKDTHFINTFEIHSFASKACISLSKEGK